MEEGKAGRRCTVLFIAAAWLSVIATLLVAFAASAQMKVIAASPATGILTVTESSSGRAWKADQQLNIFDSVYYGGQVIAPGSAGTYSFVLENSSALAADYRISFGEQNTYGVPISYRLKDSKGYLSGADSTWGIVSSVGPVTGSLEPGEGIEYTLEWKWNTTDDLTDTLLGIAARDGVTYTLDIHVEAEQEEGMTPKTGDGSWGTVLIPAIGMISAAVFFIMGMKGLIKRKKGQP